MSHFWGRVHTPWIPPGSQTPWSSSAATSRETLRRRMSSPMSGARTRLSLRPSKKNSERPFRRKSSVPVSSKPNASSPRPICRSPTSPSAPDSAPCSTSARPSQPRSGNRPRSSGRGSRSRGSKLRDEVVHADVVDRELVTRGIGRGDFRFWLPGLAEALQLG